MSKVEHLSAVAAVNVVLPLFTRPWRTADALADDLRLRSHVAPQLAVCLLATP